MGGAAGGRRKRNYYEDTVGRESRQIDRREHCQDLALPLGAACKEACRIGSTGRICLVLIVPIICQGIFRQDLHDYQDLHSACSEIWPEAGWQVG